MNWILPPTLAVFVMFVPLASTVAAEPSALPRDPLDALRFRWGSSGIREAAGRSPDSAEQASEAAYLAFLEEETKDRLDAVKLERRQLHREYRRARAQWRGGDHACHRALLDREYEVQRQALLMEAADLRSLLGYRDRQKGTTKFFIFLRSVARETVRTVGPPGLIRAALTGGGDAARRLLVETFRGVLQRRGRDVLARALTRQGRSPAAIDPVQAATARALQECQGTADQAAGAGQAAERSEPTTDSQRLFAGVGSVVLEGTIGTDFGTGRGLAEMWAEDLHQCGGFQAYNPNANVPELEGVRLRLVFDLDQGVFTGWLGGSTAASDIRRDVRGRFVVPDLRGVLTRADGSPAWRFTGTGTLSMGWHVETGCIPLDAHDPIAVDAGGRLAGSVTVTGALGEGVRGWQVSVDVGHEAPRQHFAFRAWDLLLAEIQVADVEFWEHFEGWGPPE